MTNLLLKLKNSKQRYGLIAVSLHWLITILIIFLLCMGLYMVGLEKSLAKLKLIGLHKSLGILVLALVIVRVIWRLYNITPPLPDSMERIQKLAAHLGHMALYFFMFAMPLSGWFMSSAAGLPVSVFGVFVLPVIMKPDNHLKHSFFAAHQFLAYALIATIVGHITAAFYHHFIKKDNVLTRMLPWRF